MFISTIIPTIGRPTLSRAILSVLDQDFRKEECEIIVVNDTGKDLPYADWMKIPNVQIVTTNQLNRSIARNAGAAIAKGRFLHFLDDDDWMLPEAFSAFWNVLKSNRVGWYYGGFRMTDNIGNKIADIFPDESGNCFLQLVSWEWLPIQASIIDANAFFRVGGFEMLETLEGGFEDIDLSRKISRYYDFKNIPDLICCIRSGDIGSTTNYPDMFIQNRRSRENAMIMEGSFKRLVSSARLCSSRSGYWFGRLLYCYIASAKFNFKEKRLFTTVSRLIHAFVGLCIAGSSIFTKGFRLGLLRPHFPRVWIVIKSLDVNLYSNTWN